MAGHSKWKQIKHKKAAQDSKRSNLFSKLSRLITVAAKEKGPDPETNPTLRSIIQKAKSMNMPQDSIKKAIERAVSNNSEKLENIILEGYGPAKIALLIEVITDNRNRTTQEVKNILSKNGGVFAQEGSVKWMFKQVGKITIKKSDIQDKEELELLAIDAGAEDILENDEEFEVITKKEDLFKIKNKLEERGIKVNEAELDFITDNKVKVESEQDKEKIEKLFLALDDNEDVQEIYSNIEE